MDPYDSDEEGEPALPQNDRLGRCYSAIIARKQEVRSVLSVWAVLSNGLPALIFTKIAWPTRAMLALIALAYLINAVLFREGKARRPHLKLCQIFSEILILLVSLYTCFSIPELGCFPLFRELCALNLSLFLCALYF